MFSAENTPVKLESQGQVIDLALQRIFNVLRVSGEVRIEQLLFLWG